MTTHSSVIDLIGNTPLVKLRAASEATGCTILGKAEFLNPGQSVKDRAALYIIRDAERRGLLTPPRLRAGLPTQHLRASVGRASAESHSLQRPLRHLCAHVPAFPHLQGKVRQKSGERRGLPTPPRSRRTQLVSS